MEEEVGKNEDAFHLFKTENKLTVKSLKLFVLCILEKLEGSCSVDLFYCLYHIHGNITLDLLYIRFVYYLIIFRFL